MIVCHCKVVSDRDVAAALLGGARNLSQVCRSTGAGRSCGTCIFTVKQLVCQHEQFVARQRVEADCAAS